MQTDILIVSYAHDKPWLDWCLKSIDKFATGFANVIVLVPGVERDQFADVETHPHTHLKTYDRTNDQQKWHIQHQLMKCNADSFCPTADFILHTDSDCIFTAPVTPETYFIEGKPILPIENYNRLPQRQWQSQTKRALGRTPVYETMRRHPAVHYREMYASARGFVENVHGMRFEEYVMSCKPSFPWGISEFNLLGGYIMISLWRGLYAIVDVATMPLPPNNLLQFWSHWGLEGTITDPGPHCGKRPIDIIKSILGCQ